MKIKAIYIKNLKMSEGKVAAQIAHAVKNLGITPTDCDIVVLGVSTTKFNELVSQNDCYIQRDKGLTEVESGTVTAAAWIDVNNTKEINKKIEIKNTDRKLHISDITETPQHDTELPYIRDLKCRHDWHTFFNKGYRRCSMCGEEYTIKAF